MQSNFAFAQFLVGIGLPVTRLLVRLSLSTVSATVSLVVLGCVCVVSSLTHRALPGLPVSLPGLCSGLQQRNILNTVSQQVNEQLYLSLKRRSCGTEHGNIYQESHVHVFLSSYSCAHEVMPMLLSTSLLRTLSDFRISRFLRGLTYTLLHSCSRRWSYCFASTERSRQSALSTLTRASCS